MFKNIFTLLRHEIALRLLPSSFLCMEMLQSFNHKKWKVLIKILWCYFLLFRYSLGGTPRCFVQNRLK
jgi:hypothetical protein